MYNAMKLLSALVLVVLTSCSCATSTPAKKTTTLEAKFVGPPVDKNEPYVCAWISPADMKAANEGEMPEFRDKNEDKDVVFTCLVMDEARKVFSEEAEPDTESLSTPQKSPFAKPDGYDL